MDIIEMLNDFRDRCGGRNHSVTADRLGAPIGSVVLRYKMQPDGQDKVLDCTHQAPAIQYERNRDAALRFTHETCIREIANQIARHDPTFFRRNVQPNSRESHIDAIRRIIWDEHPFVSAVKMNRANQMSLMAHSSVQDWLPHGYRGNLDNWTLWSVTIHVDPDIPDDEIWVRPRNPEQHAATEE